MVKGKRFPDRLFSKFTNLRMTSDQNFITFAVLTGLYIPTIIFVLITSILAALLSGSIPAAIFIFLSTITYGLIGILETDGMMERRDSGCPEYPYE